MGWKRPFFTWFWVNYPPNINSGCVGGPNTDIVKHYPWVGNTQFLHGFGLITHQTSTVDEWEAQNTLTSSITEDILTMSTMDRVLSYLKTLSMGLR